MRPSSGEREQACLLGCWHFRVDENAYELVEQAAIGWSAWLEQVRWQAFATLTFKNPPTIAAATSATAAWLGRLEREIYRKMPYVAVVEAHPQVHVHALLAGVGDRFVQKRIAQYWMRGLVHVHESPGIGAIRYVARKLPREESVLIPEDLRTRVRRLKWRSREIRRRFGGPVT
jgi:hypothetical protein